MGTNMPAGPLLDNDDEEENESDDQIGFQHAKGQQVINPNQKTKGKRGRKAVPPQWSRIIDLEEDDPAEWKCYEIERDMTENAENELQPPKKQRGAWKLLFEPDDFWRNTEQKSLTQNIISKRQLKHYGNVVSQYRGHYLHSA